MLSIKYRKERDYFYYREIESRMSVGILQKFNIGVCSELCLKELVKSGHVAEQIVTQKQQCEERHEN